GSLMYLTNTRPDIQSSVSLISRFMQRPTKTLWKNAMSILRYVIKTKNCKLVLSGEEVDIIRCYTDADYANDSDRKSQSGYLIKLGKSPVMWLSKKQNTVACSTAEAETAAMTIGVMDALWLQALLRELQIISSVTVLGDNKPSIQLMNNKNNSMRSKHLDVKVSFLRDLATRKAITIQHI